MTDSPSVTWPSPARTTLPLRRMDKTVVERISRFGDIGAIFDYSSASSSTLLERLPPRARKQLLRDPGIGGRGRASPLRVKRASLFGDGRQAVPAPAPQKNSS